MEAYTDHNQSGSFRGVDSIRRHAKVNAKTAREWLMGEKSYTLHKQINTKFRRR